MIITKDKVSDVVMAITKLVSQEVLVGVPAKTTERSDVPINNATIGYINEYGSPAQNIPARPHLIPGVEDAQDGINKNLKIAANAALDGNKNKTTASMEAAGVVAVNSVKSKITGGEFIPLSEATLKARARRGRKGAKTELQSRAMGNAPSTANAKPLIDTGKYRNSITYVLREVK